MVKNKGACEECARSCQLLHGSKKDLEPTVSRFFKIMIGHDFNEALFLPPKFARTLKDLVGQETKLEDSKGVCWTVVLSYYKDVLAFHKGWYEFSVDKDLNVGDFLVFNHIKGGHFVVHAFGKDGCEKLNTARKQPPVKRARISEMTAVDNTPCQVTRKDARKTKNSKTSVQIQPTKENCSPNCEGENIEQFCTNNEMYLMVNRDAEYVQSDYRTWLYDLSNFEMQEKICSASKMEEHIDGQKVSPDVGQKSLKIQSDGSLNDKSTNEIAVSTMEAAVTTNANIAGNDKDSGPTCNMSLECHNDCLDDFQNDHPLSTTSVRLSVKEVDDMSNVAVLPRSPKRKSGTLPQSPQIRGISLKKEIEMVKKVKVEIMEDIYGCGQKRAFEPSIGEEDDNSFAASDMNKAVKIVPVDSPVPLTVTTHNTRLAETNGSAFIDLPDRWPSVTFPGNGEGTATVILEDPDGKEWGGIYYENLSFRVLVAPWHKINAANGIQPRDHLVFRMADEYLNKYKFDIVHKQLEN